MSGGLEEPLQDEVKVFIKEALKGLAHPSRQLSVLERHFKGICGQTWTL